MKIDPIPSRACLAIIAIGVVSLGLFYLAAGMQRVLAVIPDDAAYYFKTAENVVGGGGLTFDGIDRTNGFQPLWLYALVAVYTMRHGTPEWMCRLCLVLQLLLLGGAAVLLAAVQGRFFSRHAVLASCLLFVFFVLVPAANGMESAVLVFFLVLLLYVGWKEDVFTRAGIGRQFVFGILLGLVMLARLDMVFLAIAIGGWCLAGVLAERGRRREAIVRLLSISAGAVVVVAPYCAYNYASFGHIAPISVALKSSFPEITVSGYTLSKLTRRAWIGLLLAGAYLVWFVRMRYGAGARRATYYEGAMAAMACTVVLHFVHALLFLKWAVFSWHFIPYALFGSTVVCAPVDRLRSAVRGPLRELLYWSALTLIVLLGAAAAWSGFAQPLDRNWRPVAYEAALWARRATDRDAVFAMKDAGNFGYFSERRVINLDGVMNDLEYQAALRDKRLAEYLRARHVRFIVQHAFWRRPDILSGDYDTYVMNYPSRLYESRGDSIVLRREDEAYRSPPYFDGPYRTVFLVWRWRGE